MKQQTSCIARSVLALAVGLLGVSTSAAATTWVVDQDGLALANDCDAVIPAFLSIGVAVSAASPGDTIVVCPGTAPYAEQLTINTDALAIEGFPGTEVVIRPAPMLANTTSLFNGGPIAAVIVVAAANTTLTNLVIDGEGAGLAGSDCSVPNLVGIYYRNASGTVSDSTVRNMRLPPGLAGCQAGLGIFAQRGSGGTATLTVDGVSVHDYQKNGIVGNETGTTITVQNSPVAGGQATAGAPLVESLSTTSRAGSTKSRAGSTKSRARSMKSRARSNPPSTVPLISSPGRF